MCAAAAIQADRTSVGRQVFGLPVVLCGILVCLTFCFCCFRFNDPDTWLHLKLGQEIWRTRAIPLLDQWSFTVNGRARVDHEWLAQVSIYASYLVWGYRGLQLWLCLLASAIVAETYLLCYRYCGDATIASLGGFLAFFFGTIGFGIRPHMIGYALLALELLLMQRAWGGRPRALWWLPLLFAVWVNCHGSWALGLGIFGAAALCSYAAGRRGCGVHGPRLGLLAGVLATTVAALLINPIGVKLLTYPVDLFVNQRTSLGFLDEWLPLNVNDVRGIGLFAVLAAMGIAGLRNRAKATAFELLVLVSVSFLAAQHIRMVFVFGIVSAPIVCRVVSELRRRGDRKSRTAPANAALLVLAAACCYVAFPSNGRIQADIESHNPVKAVEFIRRSGLQGNMMHDYMWGGYLAWALPRQKVFIDGRADIYDWAGVLARYRDWALVQTDPARLLDDYRIKFCLLSSAAPESRVMPHLRGWRTVYRDDVAVVFARE